MERPAALNSTPNAARAVGAAGAAGSSGAGTGSPVEVFRVALRLGLTSFGGPIAHLGYFRAEYVQRRAWIDEATFADLIALSQSLPGAASSKVGIAIGILRAGLVGGLAAWLGFTLPSAILLVAFALGVRALGPETAGWIHGLEVVSVAVVALAVWNMARNLAFDRARGTIAVAAAAVATAAPGGLTQLAIILASALVGWRLLAAPATASVVHVRVPFGRSLAAGAWILFFALLVALPIARQANQDHALAMFDSFYRAGSLVFGGGHVVLPLLQQEVVPVGWISNQQFLAGYGATQAVPGPLFTFSAFLGAVMQPQPNGVTGAVIALIAIFLPSFLLTIATLPSWSAIRSRPGAQAALRGVNAGVVGILLAALYNPVATNAIERPIDMVLALAALAALAIWRWPPWLVVVLTAASGALVGRFS
jgi:chromate transporter